jgi:hypothetical protein
VQAPIVRVVQQSDGRSEAHDASRQALWLAFLKKNELPPEPLPAIVGRLSVALAPALNTVAR